MDRKWIQALLEQVKVGTVDVPEAMEQLRNFPVSEVPGARIDSQRALRTGYPEVIFCLGKSRDQIVAIVDRMLADGSDVLATRCPAEVAEEIVAMNSSAVYYERSSVLWIQSRKKRPKGGLILVISAGTSDIPVAEEAAVTARSLGNRVEEIHDAGVAGLHRLLVHRPLLDEASVLIVVAGMEGALPSVVGGLVEAPVIAVPTSVGYGASFGGIAALLGMLNSCSSGVVVVNIDNGFGAGFAASLINRNAGRRKCKRKGGHP